MDYKFLCINYIYITSRAIYWTLTAKWTCPVLHFQSSWDLTQCIHIIQLPGGLQLNVAVLGPIHAVALGWVDGDSLASLPQMDPVKDSWEMDTLTSGLNFKGSLKLVQFVALLLTNWQVLSFLAFAKACLKELLIRSLYLLQWFIALQKRTKGS